MPEAPITKPQLRRLQTLSGKLFGMFGSPGQDAREFRLKFVGGKLGRDLASFGELTKAEAVTAIRAVQARLPADAIRSRPRSAGPESGRAGRRNRKGDGVPAFASAASLELLGTLRAKLGWNQDRFEAFARRQLRGRHQIRTEADANKIIWALKSMLRREAATQQDRASGREMETGAADNLAGLSACSGSSGAQDSDCPSAEEDKPEEAHP